MTDVSNPFSILFRYKYFFFSYYPYPFFLGFDFLFVFYHRMNEKPYPTWKILMTKLLLILMVVGNVGEVWSEEFSFLGVLGLEKWDIKVFTKKYPDGEIKEEMPW